MTCHREQRSSLCTYTCAGAPEILSRFLDMEADLRVHLKHTIGKCAQNMALALSNTSHPNRVKNFVMPQWTFLQHQTLHSQLLPLFSAAS